MLIFFPPLNSECSRLWLLVCRRIVVRQSAPLSFALTRLLAQAREGLARTIRVLLALDSGVSARKREINFRLVGNHLRRSLKLLDGALILSSFEQQTAQQIMSERQARRLLHGLFGERQSAFNVFALKHDVGDLAAGQNVLRPFLKLASEGRHSALF